MTLTVQAIYEDGVLKPTQPLPLTEHEKVRITIEPADNWVRATAGMLKWQGSSEDLERFAEDPDLDYPPPLEYLKWTPLAR
jgi:predicted DNA-binding antitoxin AbrB/MazE fold protein